VKERMVVGAKGTSRTQEGWEEVGGRGKDFSNEEKAEEKPLSRNYVEKREGAHDLPLKCLTCGRRKFEDSTKVKLTQRIRKKKEGNSTSLGVIHPLRTPDEGLAKTMRGGTKSTDFLMRFYQYI